MLFMVREGPPPPARGSAR